MNNLPYFEQGLDSKNKVVGTQVPRARDVKMWSGGEDVIESSVAVLECCLIGSSLRQLWLIVLYLLCAN